ncbi:MAG: hypothetical protein HY905_15960 [Deltaproteobacteria bacterium]|nr:hypothetical protein [Deltaproteobacteria bacterium]
MRTALFAACSLALLPGCESTHEYFDIGAAEADAVAEAGDAEAGETDEDAAETDDAPVGTEPCSAVLTCMQACSDTPCVDACQATVCPANADELGALMSCVERECATECADFSDPACTPCVTGACLAEGSTCYAATCG